jgi:hypothetical protein
LRVEGGGFGKVILHAGQGIIQQDAQFYGNIMVLGAEWLAGGSLQQGVAAGGANQPVGPFDRDARPSDSRCRYPGPASGWIDRSPGRYVHSVLSVSLSRLSVLALVLTACQAAFNALQLVSTPN